MAHPGEPLIHVVRTNKPKGRTGLDHKGGDQVETSPRLSPADVGSPADRRSLTHPVVRVRNVGSPSLSREGKRAVRRAHGGAGRGRWKKRRPSCHGVERGGVSDNITPRASGLTSYAGLASRERLAHGLRRQSRGQQGHHQLVRSPATRWPGMPSTGRRPTPWCVGSKRVS